MKRIKIFIASSSELKEDRDQFRLFISQENDRRHSKGIYLEIVQWENFLDAISDTRLQDEYNNAISGCDIVLCLFFTKVGKYTAEEFDTAYQVFKDKGKPKIWTYFKNAQINTGSITDEINTLLAFKKKIGSMGHFYSEYTNIDNLINKYRTQLDKFLVPFETRSETGNIDTKPAAIDKEPIKNTGQTNYTQIVKNITGLEDVSTREISWENDSIGDFSEKMEQSQNISDQVEFSVFSPNAITSGSNFILDVWASFLHQSSEVLLEAKSLGRERRLGVKKGISVSLGANLQVSVNIDSLDIEGPYDTLEWKGNPINASFSVHVPEETKVGSYNGKAIVSYNSIVIAKVIFLVYIGEKEKMDYENINQTTFYPKSAFASYSSEDRIAVLSRIDGMKKIAPNIDVFCDVLTLRSGEDWLERIKEEVPSKDIFYLFWSHNAAESKWVEEEWKLALKERGIEYIDPVPLEDVDMAPPPPELKKKHFSSNISNLIQILEWKKQWKEDRLNV